jgi:histidyl-tRNA synthetase
MILGNFRPQSLSRSSASVDSSIFVDANRVKAQAALSTSLETHMAGHGYEKFDTPIIQSAELFLTKAGDQIINRLFTFERRGQLLALRPEFTASAAKAYIQKFPQGDQVVRWQFHGAVFEEDPNHQFSERERFSIGAELIGHSGIEADAEVIAMAANGLEIAGIQNWQIIIGQIQLLRLLIAHFQIDNRTARFLLFHLGDLHDPNRGKSFVLHQLDAVLSGGNRISDDVSVSYSGNGVADETTAMNTQQILDVLLDATQHGVTMGGRTRHDIVRRLLQKRQRAAERPQIILALDFLAEYAAIADSPSRAFKQIEQFIDQANDSAHTLLSAWRELIEALNKRGISLERIQIRPSLSRNWDYYTGILFELQTADGVKLGGGGRYDELTRLIGGERDVPAVGVAYYADNILDLPAGA